MSTWNNGPVPNSEIGEKVEMFSRVDPESWFHVVGSVFELDGEPGMDPSECDLMEFTKQEDLPAPAEGNQLWRRLV